jgi:hypothetical protein
VARVRKEGRGKKGEGEREGGGGRRGESCAVCQLWQEKRTGEGEGEEQGREKRRE